MTPGERRSDEQALVERIRERLARDPARMNRMRVQWDIATGLIAGYAAASSKRWKVYEVHHITIKARIGMLRAIEAGAPDACLWVHAMHVVGFPAAPHPKAKRCAG